MRTHITTVSALLCATLAGLAVAGPVTPSAGPVGPTGKTLSEVEPRIAVNATNTPGDADATPSTFKITQPGSYYLTGNITGEVGKYGIEIASQGVTLDLNGFSVTGVAGSKVGVYLRSTCTSVEVRNGLIRSWGEDGLTYEAPCYRNRVVDVRAASNGASGITVGSYSEVRNCSANGNGGNGISIYSVGRAEGCNAQGNGGDGIAAPNSGNVLVNCVSGNNTGDGISSASGNTVTNCTVLSNGQCGVRADGTAVKDCSSQSNGEYGFNLGGSSFASGNRASSNTFGGFYTEGNGVLENNSAFANGAAVNARAGFVVNGAAVRLANNTATSNPIGFYIANGPAVLTGNTAMSNTVTGFTIGASANALLTGNTAAANTTNYSIGAGNDSGAVITNPGIGFSTTNPAANYAN